MLEIENTLNAMHFDEQEIQQMHYLYSYLAQVKLRGIEIRNLPENLDPTFK